MVDMQIDSSRVSFASGAVCGEGTVLAVHGTDDGGRLVVVDETPFHPVDHGWPDQPGDTGRLSWPGGGTRVTACLMAALSPDGAWHTGAEIPVRRGTEGWSWLVAHRTEGPAPETGQRVLLHVDAEERAALNRGHTACHLAALALNETLAELWSKPARPDSLGSPDFDGAACRASRILPDGSQDEYRLGKSLRRSGLDTASLLERLDEARERVNARLTEWIGTGAPVRVEAEGPGIVDLRHWVCELPEGTARIRCGGTHVRSLGELAAAEVELDSPEPQALVMRVRVRPSV